jgi:hypothetical protein
LLIRRLLLLALPLSSAFGFIGLNPVQLTGVTATQAVLTYMAPTTVCSVAASASPSYAPLVPDVDPALFAAANWDNRMEAISLGKARIFVLGKRVVETALNGQNYSRALQAATTYYYQITCGTNVFTGSFVTAAIPAGQGHGEPIPTDPNHTGNYLFPTFSTSSRAAAVVEPHTGALVKNLTLPSDLEGGASAQMGPSGSGSMCHPTPVKASNGTMGYHCQIFVGGLPGLYWIAPATGEVRFLGVMSLNYTNNWNDSTMCAGDLSAPFDGADPNTFYCLAANSDNRHILVKATYSGHSKSGLDNDLSGVPAYNLNGMPSTTYAPLMLYDRDILTLITEFDPDFNQGCCGTSGFYYFDVVGTRFVFKIWPHQDGPGELVVFDLAQTPAMQKAKFGSAKGCLDNEAVTSAYSGQPGCVVGSVSTIDAPQGTGLRYSTLHVVEANSSLGAFVPIGMNSLRSKSQPYYSVTLPAGLSNVPTPCLMAQPAGNPLTNWPNTPAMCSTITVSAEPAVSSSTSLMPSVIPAQPGDTLSVDSGNYTVHEVMRLLDKGADGKTWYVQRQWVYGNAFPYAGIAPGGTLDLMSPMIWPSQSSSGMHVYWDSANGPHGETGSIYQDVLGPEHISYSASRFGNWTAIYGQAQTGSNPARLINPPPVMQMGLPSFNGQSLTLPYVEAHPSLSVTNPPDAATFNLLVDNHPYFGAAGYVTQPLVTNVGGQLYRIRGLNPSPASTYKQIEYFANSGNRAMSEVSGPAVQLSTGSDSQFEWCVALNAGECFAGSQTGDVYFNAPGVAIPYCAYNWETLQTTSTVANDICVAQANAFVQSVKIQGLANDPNGMQERTLSNALDQYDTETVFWNSRTLPDGSWVFTNLAADPSVKLIKVPPIAMDLENRTGYVPVTVTIPPAANNSYAAVAFGYAENGHPANFYCMARQEACIAQGTAISSFNPFYFSSTEAGSITGTPCVKGCTITIPAIAGRVLYYLPITSKSQTFVLPSTLTNMNAIAVK